MGLKTQITTGYQFCGGQLSSLGAWLGRTPPDHLIKFEKENLTNCQAMRPSQKIEVTDFGTLGLVCK